MRVLSSQKLELLGRSTCAQWFHPQTLPSLMSGIARPIIGLSGQVDGGAVFTGDLTHPSLIGEDAQAALQQRAGDGCARAGLYACIRGMALFGT
ncbi:MAG: hypothetical protein ACK2UO_05760 [Caldilineaceae bacterium]